MFDTPHALRQKTIWPTEWIERELVYPPPVLILTCKRDRFVCWGYRDLYYSIRSFRYYTRWWHFSRPDRITALRQAMAWVRGRTSEPSEADDRKNDLTVVREIVDDYEERDKQLAAIDDLLDPESPAA